MLDDSKHCIRTIEIFARHQTSCIYRDLIILSIRTINAISEHNNLHVAIGYEPGTAIASPHNILSLFEYQNTSFRIPKHFFFSKTKTLLLYKSYDVNYRKHLPKDQYTYGGQLPNLEE